MSIYVIVLIVGGGSYITLLYLITIKTNKLSKQINSHHDLFFGSRKNLKNLTQTSEDPYAKKEAAMILRMSNAARLVPFAILVTYLILMFAGIKG